jgi:CheY-like chemotaxis protein
MPKKILLADDSITIQKVVELTFSDGDYEVTAVNNGAKAIAKLAEMRPDIILSDIIMPEKNGYEVCEYVKSHPEYRNLPVVLLTGTFEPFDPDRADKAGCDAVVTKPFESQGLIQKVEELIAASRAGAAATATTAVSAAFAPEPAPDFSSPATPFAPPPTPSAPAAPEPFAHNADVFGAVPEPSTSTTEMPFETPEAAFGGETRAFPRMSFDELQKMASPTTPEPVLPSHEPAPWEDAPAHGGETRAFPRMTFDELQKMDEPTPPPPPPAAAEPSPWDQPAATGGETRAFQSMSFDDLQKMAAPASPPAAPPPAPESEPSPWDEPASAGGETRAFPSMSFDELQKMAASPEPAAPAAEHGMPFDTPAEPPPATDASPWDEAPAFGGETRAFPRMSFDELQKMATEPAPPPAAEHEPAPWSPPVEASPTEEAASPFAEPPHAADESPFAAAPAAEPEPMWATPEPEHTPPPPIAEEAMPTTVNSQITDAVVDPSAPPAAAAPHGDLTDEQVDRIARRVVQLMSEQVVKNIAWEVIPDLAEIVVKERIRQLESES